MLSRFQTRCHVKDVRASAAMQLVGTSAAYESIVTGPAN